MKNSVISVVGALCGIVALSMSTSLSAADKSFLADRHAQKGVACSACHGQANPKTNAVVRNETCFACHQNYDILAKRTAKIEPNPHFTHLGNVRCSDCHKGHRQSTLMCNDCHKFSITPK